MGLFDKVMGTFYVDGVEIKEMQNALLEVETDKSEYEVIKLLNLTDVSLSGVWYGGIDLAKGNDNTVKTVVYWDDYAATIGHFLREMDERDRKQAISKQIRRSSYRKTKSQRRRGERK